VTVAYLSFYLRIFKFAQQRYARKFEGDKHGAAEAVFYSEVFGLHLYSKKLKIFSIFPWELKKRPYIEG